MAARSLPSLSSACVFCRSLFERPRIFTQTRFASSRRRKNEHIVVQLIQDVPKWGPEGQTAVMLAVQSSRLLQDPSFPSLAALCAIPCTEVDKPVMLLEMSLSSS